MRLDILTIKLQHKGPKTGDTHCLTEVNGATQDFIQGVGRKQPYGEGFTGALRTNKALFYHICESFQLNLIAFILSQSYMVSNL